MASGPSEPATATRDRPGLAAPGTRGEALRRSLYAGGRFLLRHQSPDGAWRDFSTKPGISDAWTTAYVGLCLLTLPEPRPIDWRSALERAALWLRERMDRGWGYNANCPPDADSSALAILFLRHCGVDVTPAAYSRLWSFSRPDGGFATYLKPDERDSWAVSHPCVTPVAVHAMLTCLAPDDPRLAAAYDYIRSGQTAAGNWQSFWWRSPLYGTRVNLEAVLELELAFDRESLARYLRAQEPTAAFERALLAFCHTLLGELDEAGEVVASLLDQQQPDGGWPSEPIQRLTRRSCFEPWLDPDPGPLLADQERLFTTATALRSLATWRDRIAGAPGALER